MPTVQTGLRIPVELYDYLKDRAEKEHRTISNLIIDILTTEKDKVCCRECKYAHLTYAGECKYCDLEDGDDPLYYDGDYSCGFGKKKDD